MYVWVQSCSLKLIMFLGKHKRNEKQTWNQTGFTGIVLVELNRNSIHGWIKGSCSCFVHYIILNPRLLSL